MRWIFPQTNGPIGLICLPGAGRLFLMESTELKDPNGVIFNLWENN